MAACTEAAWYVLPTSLEPPVGFALEHDPEKWIPVFRKARPRARPEGSCSIQNLERDRDSIENDRALTNALAALRGGNRLPGGPRRYPATREFRSCSGPSHDDTLYGRGTRMGDRSGSAHR